MSDLASISAKVAHHISTAKTSITTSWMLTVQADQSISSADSLTTDELRNHLPELLDDLAKQLLSPQSTLTARDAQNHGFQRWEHAYRLGEVLREFARLRHIILDHIFALENTLLDLRAELRHEVLKRVHWFFDEMISASTQAFLQKHESRLTSQVDDATLKTRDALTAQVRLEEIDISRMLLLRTAAHELRNSFNASNLLTQNLLEEDTLEKCHEVGRTLMRNGKHMVAVLQDLLDYSLSAGDIPKALDLQVVLLRDFGEELATIYRSQAHAKGLLFTPASISGNETVVTDRVKLRQIADNLITNAIKFTDRGAIRLIIEKDQHDWSLIVEDTGRGISPDEQQHLFRERYRAPGTEDIHGAGLGLTITKQLVEAVEGTISINSTIGKGTRFEVSLPILPKTLT